MKQLLLFSLLAILCLGSCDNNNSTEVAETPKIVLPKENPKFPTPDKVPKQKTMGSTMVESEVKIEEAPVDDKTVNYRQLGRAMCDCAKRSNELNSQMEAHSEAGNAQAFTKMVPEVNKAYEESVACALEQANALNSEFSLNSMVKEMKQACGFYHDKLIFQMVMAIKNR